MPTVAELVQQTRQQLLPVAQENAALEARLLVQHALDLRAEDLVRDGDALAPVPASETLHRLLQRRLHHEPLSHILGSKDFWRDTFHVTADVLTPRADSETVIESVLKLPISPDAPIRVLDLGVGSGCLLLSVLREFPHATGVGVDLSPAALAVAKQNAAALGLADRVEFYCGAWCNPLDKVDRFAIVISNPPYIPSEEIAGLAMDVKGFEPHLALDGGEDGLECYRQLCSTIPSHLLRDAWVLFEVGAGQAADVAILGEANGLRHVNTTHDLAGIDRVVIFQK